MPLKKGDKSQKALSNNISELMGSFKRGGQFAKGKPSEKARQMAVAAAFSIKRRSKR